MPSICQIVENWGVPRGELNAEKGISKPDLADDDARSTTVSDIDASNSEASERNEVPSTTRMLDFNRAGSRRDALRNLGHEVLTKMSPPPAAPNRKKAQKTTSAGQQRRSQLKEAKELKVEKAPRPRIPKFSQDPIAVPQVPQKPAATRDRELLLEAPVKVNWVSSFETSFAPSTRESRLDRTKPVKKHPIFPVPEEETGASKLNAHVPVKKRVPAFLLEEPPCCMVWSI
jgi:hypothetical protein